MNEWNLGGSSFKNCICHCKRPFTVFARKSARADEAIHLIINIFRNAESLKFMQILLQNLQKVSSDFVESSEIFGLPRI